ncbi:hypothetical protein NLY43_24155 [Mesorhizobium sp. C416B]|uniref:hypothetical protein n=1 Tax=unclassified Mesorhizobium TaxID=325217 RepID=UPI0003CDFDBA|nr:MULTISPECIES: hypothetical protein [unclassified Mesorhizobium]ESX49396.1 hypothetical protein X762_10985 [Mesorhizobium sp. LSHC426A00]WJI61680.1 hypothetical protein NLY43_24155 [Mesorhizobium sp. C416B]
MEYETPEETKLLKQVAIVFAECKAAGIEYEEVLAAINAAYGGIKRPRTVTSKEDQKAHMSVNRAEAMVNRRRDAIILAGMTGAQVRLAKKLADEN